MTKLTQEPSRKVRSASGPPILKEHAAKSMIPLWIKIVFSLFMAVLVPTYWSYYTPVHFLWFCDIALIMTLFGLWGENRILIGASALGVILCDVIWMVDFAAVLATGKGPLGITVYMFDSNRESFLKVLSLFHIWVPVLLLWVLWRLGYDRRSLLLQIAISWVVLPLSYLLTNGPGGGPNGPGNMNRVWGLGDTPHIWMHPWIWVAALMAAFPVLVYLPTHLIFRLLFREYTPTSGIALPLALGRQCCSALSPALVPAEH